MRRMLTIALAIALSGTIAQAQMLLYEDFESYTVDATIHLQGTDQTDMDPGVDIPRWYMQKNQGALGDTLYSNVRDFGGNQVLEIDTARYHFDTTLYPDGKIESTVAAAMSMESQQIDTYGTIYLRYAVNKDLASCSVLTNDLEAGWDYDNLALVDPGTITADGWQMGMSGEGYSHMGAFVQASGGMDFGAWNSGTVENDSAIQNPSQKWMELWIQVDQVGDRTRYFICQQGGTPVKAMNGGGDWWTMRNGTHENDSVQNLKFMIGNWSDMTPADGIRRKVYLDTIGIEHFATLAELENSTLNTVGPALLPDVFAADKPGDADGDGDVDLDDFVILKNEFGTTPVPPAVLQADFDGDGDVDLDDFVILKSNFGT